METSKIITLRKRRFRIDMLSARDGSWVTHQAMAKRMPLGIDKTLPGLNPKRGDLDEAEFHAIQDKVLGAVSELIGVNGQDAAKRIFESGIFAVPGIENDPNLILQLTRIAFVHNVLPFFIDPDSESSGTDQ